MAVVEKNVQVPKDEWMQRLTYSKSFRVKYDLAWFATQMFVEQNAFYAISGSELKEKRPPKGARTIAKARKMLRSIKTSLTKEDPRRQPKSFCLEDDHTDEEKYVASKVLEKTFRDVSIKELIKDLIHNSMMKSIGFREIYRDGNRANINELDAFDVYLDPHGRLRGPRFQGRWMIKAIPIPVDIANKKRPQPEWEAFVADNSIAESPQKITMKNNEETTQKDSRFGTIMVYEIYIKDTPEVKAGAEEWDNKVVATPELTKTPYTPDNVPGGVTTPEPQEQVNTTVEQIRRIIYIKSKVIKDERLDTTEFPIICYQPERAAGKIYPVSWMDPIIELNKSINRIYTSLEDRVYTFSKGRYLAKRNENITNISDQNGQIVYYDNVPPMYMQQWSPGSTPFDVIKMSEQYVDDFGGIHAESTGSTSGANIRSSSQIMQIQAGDIQNMSEPLDNLKSFMSIAGEMILSLISKNMIGQSSIRVNWKIIPIVGSEATTELDKLTQATTTDNTTPTTVKIKPFTNIGVDIIAGTAYTDIQARQDLITLREVGVQIPDEILLDTFKIWDTQEILLKMQIANARNANPDIDIATAENKKMLMGQEVMADITDNHQIHKAIHAKLLESNQSNQELVQRIIAHIRQHEAFEKPAPTTNPLDATTTPGEIQLTPPNKEPKPKPNGQFPNNY